jgi:AMP nucleosidase
MKERLEIARNWLPRYTGMALEEFGDYILLTNFQNYLERFAERFNCEIKGEGRPRPRPTRTA